MIKILCGLVSAQAILPEGKRQSILTLIEANATNNHDNNTISDILEYSLGCWLCHEETGFKSQAGHRVYIAWSKVYDMETLSLIRKHLTPGESDEIENEAVERIEFNISDAHIPQLCTWISQTLTLELGAHDIMLIQQFVGQLTSRIKSLDDLHSFAALINKNPLHFLKSILPVATVVLSTIVQLMNKFQLTSHLSDFAHYVMCCEEIGKLCVLVWDYSSAQTTLITQTLETVFQLILQKSESPPALGLSCVLQAVPEMLISKLCDRIVTFDKINSDQLLNIGITLSIWMAWPKHKTIHVWTSSFAKSLYENGKHKVLYEYVDQCAPTLVPKLQYANYQQTTIYVLEELLLRHQICPAAFHRCITEHQLLKKIEMIKVDSSRSRLYRLIQVLMYIHPGYPDLYNKILPSIPAEQMMNEEEMEAVKTQYKTQPKHQLLNLLQTSSIKTKISHIEHTGLENLGNTCYLNSVVQTLFMIKQFRTSVMKTDCNTGIIGELRKLFTLLQYTSRCELNPQQFVDRCQPSWFRSGEQQDSSEYLRYLLDKLNEFYTQTKLSGDPTTLFRGSLIYTTECFVCKTPTDKIEELFDLSLHFTPQTSENPSQVSVREMISNLFEPELLIDDNQFHCDKCGRLVDACRTLTKIKPPDILTLTLCRFEPDTSTNTHRKIKTHVIFDEHLKMSGTEYELRSVIVHSGSTLNGGHYYTYCQDHTQKSWLLFNDGRVTPCKSPANDTTRHSTQTSQSDTPYILIYINKQLAHTGDAHLESLPSDLKQTLRKDQLSLVDEQEAEAIRRKVRHTPCQLNDNIYNYKPDDDDDNTFGGNNGADISGSRFVF